MTHKLINRNRKKTIEHKDYRTQNIRTQGFDNSYYIYILVFKEKNEQVEKRIKRYF